MSTLTLPHQPGHDDNAVAARRHEDRPRLLTAAAVFAEQDAARAAADHIAFVGIPGAHVRELAQDEAARHLPELESTARHDLENGRRWGLIAGTLGTVVGAVVGAFALAAVSGEPTAIVMGAIAGSGFAGVPATLLGLAAHDPLSDDPLTELPPDAGRWLVHVDTRKSVVARRILEHHGGILVNDVP